MPDVIGTVENWNTDFRIEENVVTRSDWPKLISVRALFMKEIVPKEIHVEVKAGRALMCLAYPQLAGKRVLEHVHL